MKILLILTMGTIGGGAMIGMLSFPIAILDSWKMSKSHFSMDKKGFRKMFVGETIGGVGSMFLFGAIIGLFAALMMIGDVSTYNVPGH